MHLQYLKIEGQGQENLTGKGGQGQAKMPQLAAAHMGYAYQGAKSVCKPAASLPSLPRGPTQSAVSNA